MKGNLSDFLFFLTVSLLLQKLDGPYLKLHSNSRKFASFAHNSFT